MDARPAVTSLLRCRRGTTLLEAVVCLAVLGLFLTGFVRHLGGTAAAGSRLAERTAAEGVASQVRALLSAEDPWAAPDARTFSLGSDGLPAEPGAASYDVRVDGSARCVGPPTPADNALGPATGRCADGSRAVRRWHVTVSWDTRYSEPGRDSVTTDLDVDSGLSTATTGALLP